MHLLNPPDWIKSDGTLYKYGATLAAGTYYAVIPLQGSCEFGGTFLTDGALEATATVDGNDVPTSVAAATDYAATGTGGWTDESAITDVAMTAGTTSWALGHVVDFERARARVKLVVTTGGVITFYPTLKAE